MSRNPLSPRPTALPDDDEGLAMPSPEALLAGTLALMTGVVERAALLQPLAAHGQSLLMASKVRVNLRGLVEHPQLSPAFRSTLERLRGHWDRLAVSADAAAPAASSASCAETQARLWHRAPERLQ
jgi:hypothetical protein